jgi:Lipoprotein LpqB beta-propeller domain
MNGVPEELANAVERAAAMVPGHGGDLDDVLFRYRARRRHRAAGAAAAAVAVALVAAGAAVARPLIATGGTAVLPSAAATTTSAQVTPQRLILDYSAGDLTPKHTQAGIGEMLADGSVVTHPVAGSDGGYQAVGLPDGRLVVLLTRIGPPRLSVLRPDGTVQHTYPISVPAGRVGLAGATEDDAYLLGSSGLIARNLATGAERAVLDLVALGMPGWLPDITIDLAGDRLVLTAMPGKSCSLRVIDVPSGRRLPEPALPRSACRQILGVRVSPDGRRIAVAYSRPDQSLSIRVAIVDTVTGQVRQDSPLKTSPAHKGLAGVYGMAWIDPATVRVAWTGTTSDTGSGRPIEELPQIATITS